MANAAGMTLLITKGRGCLKTALAKYTFMPAGGHKKPISKLARKMMPK
jgi:hypothetical protein